MLTPPILGGGAKVPCRYNFIQSVTYPDQRIN